MTEEDKELEILKAKRLAEMEKNLAQQNNQEEKETMLGNSDQNKLLPREQIIKKLGYRGLEVLSNAESQFPNETRLVEEKLAELIQSGEIDEVLDGGKLLTLFRSVGIRVRMENKINVEKDGKFVSISEKFVKQTDDSSFEEDEN
jgi:DNA-binding TFAR19-related protein (PDSD5 family)